MIKKECIAQVKSLSHDKKAHVLEMSHALAKFPWVEAIALGGSHASGMATKGSDVDLGIYYSANTPPLDQLREAAKQFCSNSNICRFEKWNAYNRATSFTTEKGKYDWFCHNFDKMNDVLNKAKEGVFYWDFNGMALDGFSSVQYLSWLSRQIILYDPNKTLARLCQEAEDYPLALRNGLVQECLNTVVFFLPIAESLANQNCTYAAVGYITHIANKLTEALFAINRTYYYAAKAAMHTIESFVLKPKEYAHRIRSLLCHLGEKQDLTNSIRKLEALIQEVVVLAKANV